MIKKQLVDYFVVMGGFLVAEKQDVLSDRFFRSVTGKNLGVLVPSGQIAGISILMIGSLAQSGLAAGRATALSCSVPSVRKDCNSRCS